MLIDWNRLQPYKTTKSKSFEQLCYQIASKLYYAEGSFTPVDDSGGGDGVEFYLTRPNGSEDGWQAKFYDGLARLNVSNRKSSIISSLERAAKRHPNLKKWFLCLNMDLTVEERKWVDTELTKNIPAGSTIEIVIWDETFLHEKINQPMFSGLKQSFFNELELSTNWFQKTFDKSFSIIKNKFDELLYVPNETFENHSVDPILCNEKFIEQRIKVYPSIIVDLYELAKEKLNELYDRNIPWKPLIGDYLIIYRDFNLAIERLLPVLAAEIENISPNNIHKLAHEDYSNDISHFDITNKKSIEIRRNWDENNARNLDDVQQRAWKEQEKKLRHVEEAYRSLAREFENFVRHSRTPLKRRQAHFFGNGGDGKTNLAVAIVRQNIAQQLPALYIPAIQFTGDNPLSDQILSILDIKSGYSFGNFLDCLNELGRINNIRVPVVLDGLNEAINAQGSLNNRLSIDLPQLETSFLHRTNLALFTTCRTSYQDAIWGEVNPDDERFDTIYGFIHQDDKKNLIKKYFTHYKIQADLSFLSLDRFTKPLYLKLFCESVNSDRKQIKQVTLGYDSIYLIFERFVSLCDENIFKRIQKNGKLNPTVGRKNLASQVLTTISEYLWRSHRRSFRLDDLSTWADGESRIDYKDSIAKALLDEELLFIRNWQDEEERVFITYDLMSGYFIAKYLIDGVTDFTVLFEDENLKLILGNDYEKLHPYHEDITNGLCSLLPVLKGVFVHDLINQIIYKDTSLQHQLFERSISATILLSPEFIPSKQVEYVRLLSQSPENMIRLIGFSEDVLFVTNHPFNFSFWSPQLQKLAMNKRDTTWTEYLRHLRDGFLDDLIDEFELLLATLHLSEEQVKKIHLVADFLKWTFTSTNNNLRNKSGNALYQFSTKFPLIFLNDYYQSARINDPNIFEWMTAIIYNTTIFIVKHSKDIYESDLVFLASFLHNEVLNKDSPLSTNHLIVRNYAFDTLKLLIRKFPELAKTVDLIQLKRGFKNIGITEWAKMRDLNENQYRDGNMLIDYFFNKEKMPYISEGKGNEYNITPAYRAIQAKLRWRAYQLGYDFQLFGALDIQLARFRHWGDEYANTERYADKYLEIAFLEYCGYLDSRGKLKSYDDAGYLRTFKLKHDPTTIENFAFKSAADTRVLLNEYIDSEVPLSKWCSDDSIPDISEYLTRDSFQEKTGNWVLLNGLVHQNKKTKERQIFIKVVTVFVRNKNLRAARRAFSKETKLGHGPDNIPQTLNIHQSEIPDADSIPYNKFTYWYYSIKSKMLEREYRKIVLFSNGQRLNETEADEMWEIVMKQMNVFGYPRIQISESTVPMIQVKYGDDDMEDENLVDTFKRMNIELREEKIKKQEPQEIEKSIAIFIPVRYHNDKVYLCKNMIDDLNLVSPSGTTDLDDQNGELASFNHTYHKEYVDQETFTYIRRDLLDTYLKTNDLTMFQIIWGERDYYPIDGNWDNDRKRTQSREWATFYDSKEYKITAEK